MIMLLDKSVVLLVYYLLKSLVLISLPISFEENLNFNFEGAGKCHVKKRKKVGGEAGVGVERGGGLLGVRRGWGLGRLMTLVLG